MICCHGALVRLSGGDRQDGQMLSLTVSVLAADFSLWYLIPVVPTAVWFWCFVLNHEAQLHLTKWCRNNSSQQENLCKVTLCKELENQILGGD